MEIELNLRILTLILATSVCHAIFPFRNISLPLDVRVNDLVKRLTPEELVQQMSRGGGGGDGGPVLPIPRLGIEPYWWATECLHGDASGAATSFPQSIGLAATFSPELIKSVASAISIEVRAKNNDFVKRKIYQGHSGLSCFSPVINIMRHPLWGRNQETYGEDPYLSGILASNFVEGLKGDHPRYYRANAICKHFDAYGGPEDLPQSRLSFDAKVSEQDWHMTYLPQFKRCVQSGAMGVMCSYNSINGIPACAHKELLTDILRTSWNFTGFVISDQGAVEFMIYDHRYVLNIQKAAVMSVEAGLNLELHPDQATGVLDWLLYAYEDKQISLDLLIKRVRPLFYTRMKLGEFDPPGLNPYLKLNLSQIQSPTHRELATLAAMRSFVLLKNDGVLPIMQHPKTVAIVGPFANNSQQLMGNYAPSIDPRYMVNVARGLSALGAIVSVESGCSDTKCLDYQPSLVEKAVADADVVFVCLGTGAAIETENFDRQDMLLPGYQEKMLTDVIQATHGKIVLLLFSAGPLDIRMAHSSPAVTAILQCFFPNQATGTALYNMVTYSSREASPSGRLPFTWYSSDAQVPSMTYYSMWNRTYRYFYGDDPLYPFGYGLSYTTFQFNNLDLSPTTIKAGQNVTASFQITNTGSFSGREVFEVYISWLNATVPTPIHQLVDFGSVMIDKGQTVKLNATITSEVMAVWVTGKGFVIEPGEIVVYVGGQLPNQKTKAPSNVLKAMFTIQ